MPEAGPTTQTMNVTDAREHWSQVIKAVFRLEQRVVLERAGIPVAALISSEDFERLRRYDAEREADFAVIDRMRAAFRDVPDKELERQVTKAISEARADLRVEHAQAQPSG